MANCRRSVPEDKFINILAILAGSRDANVKTRSESPLDRREHTAPTRKIRIEAKDQLANSDRPQMSQLQWTDEARTGRGHIARADLPQRQKVRAAFDNQKRVMTCCTCFGSAMERQLIPVPQQGAANIRRPMRRLGDNRLVAAKDQSLKPAGRVGPGDDESALNVAAQDAALSNLEFIVTIRHERGLQPASNLEVSKPKKSDTGVQMLARQHTRSGRRAGS